MERQPIVQKWYQNTVSQRSPAEIVHEAHESARKQLANDLTDQEYRQLFIERTHSLEDVTTALEDAKQSYESRPRSKARFWLGVLSQKVVYYSSVLDVLSQHHPEYVSLAWGAMKFIFTAIISHEETTKKLAKFYSRIADLIPITELTLSLYQTAIMQEAVAHLYARIMKFMAYSIRWYKMSKLMHAWKSVATPWALEFQEFEESIREQAKRVKGISNTATKAELRDTHLEVIESREELRTARTEISCLTVQFMKFKVEMGKLLDYAQKSSALNTQMSLNVISTKNTMSQAYLNQLLTHPIFLSYPTPGQCLEYCQSLSRRAPNRCRPLLPDTVQLATWASQDRSSFLVAENSDKMAIRDFLVRLVDLIRPSPYPIIWALRFPDYWDRKLSLVDFLRMLTIQALKHSEATPQGEFLVTSSHLQEAANEDDWLNILNAAFRNIPVVYIVLDMDLLAQVMSYNRRLTTHWLKALCTRLTNTKIKVFVSTVNFDEAYAMRNWNMDEWEILKTREGTGMRSSTRRRRNPAHIVRREMKRVKRLLH